VGTALVAAVRAWAAEQGLARIDLRAAVQNPLSTRFWRRQGFVPYLETLAWTAAGPSPGPADDAVGSRQLWAPWRLTFVEKKPEPGCFFCRAWAERGRERESLLVARGELCLVMLNRYPYTSGHLLVAPVRHAGLAEEITAAEAAEMWRLAVLAKRLLGEAMSPAGFNLGINQGEAGGAGVRDHLHFHVVPRWLGDTSFMPVLAGVRVMPAALEATWERLRPAFAREGL
jgi:ATP adenylyltransferase